MQSHPACNVHLRVQQMTDEREPGAKSSSDSQAQHDGKPHVRGRPRGSVRQALAAWAVQWRAQGWPDGLPLPELARFVPGIDPASPADLHLVRVTVTNMVTAGELVRVGALDRPGRAGRPRALYAPGHAPNDDGAAALASVLAGWR